VTIVNTIKLNQGNAVINSFTPIAHIVTPFSQKFSIPRQSLSLSVAKGAIIFSDDVDVTQSLDGIEGFSHLWLLFLFHENLAQGYKAKVRPPRLGGNKKVGVFASRSSFRPNGIGMSVVKNLGIKNNTLMVAGVDLLCMTPILDIKPYLPYADIVNEASAGYAHEKPSATLTAHYSDQAKEQLAFHQHQYPDLTALLDNILTQDPRPSYKQHQQDQKIYFIQLYDLEVKWSVNNTTIDVIAIYPVHK
jgi:tRNA-Thr(GGU) m(6)t(6)A37 methyltransferase TsaA